MRRPWPFFNYGRCPAYVLHRGLELDDSVGRWLPIRTIQYHFDSARITVRLWDKKRNVEVILPSFSAAEMVSHRKRGR